MNHVLHDFFEANKINPISVSKTIPGVMALANMATAMHKMHIGEMNDIIVPQNMRAHNLVLDPDFELKREKTIPKGIPNVLKPDGIEIRHGEKAMPLSLGEQFLLLIVANLVLLQKPLA